MKGNRTEDNLFVLRIVYSKYVSSRCQKVFLAFVDFKKNYTINRKYLLYKLLRLNIPGNCYSLIKSMYDQCEYCVKAN